MLTVSLLVCAMMALATAEGENHSDFCSTSNAPNDAGVPSCPPSWSQNNGRCFLYVPRELDWADAEKNCQSLKGNLASVHSVEEYQFIQRMITEHTQANPLAWIGGSDSQKNNVWFWSDGRPFSFTFWCAGEPNNQRGNQGCIQMNQGGKIQQLTYQEVCMELNDKSHK
ncbi:ladderlectin-like [Etheostoma cragini]|uniref:ladderlectin-like n=1 Tax=Etheostoma cragini TaxID=417921 RepID=UPI00155EA9A9|nr:ladderlectin-like [Etheostoma cragini]